MEITAVRPFSSDLWCIAERVGTNDTTYSKPMSHADALLQYSHLKQQYAATYATRAMPTWFVAEEVYPGGRKFVASAALVPYEEACV